MNGNGFLTCMNELGMNRSGSRKGVTPGGYSWFKKTYINRDRQRQALRDRL